jgi:hypothetical protein
VRPRRNSYCFLLFSMRRWKEPDKAKTNTLGSDESLAPPSNRRNRKQAISHQLSRDTWARNHLIDLISETVMLRKDSEVEDLMCRRGWLVPRHYDVVVEMW